LIIKQARPWVSFWSDITSNNDLGVTAITEPQSSSSLGASELVSATIGNFGLNDMSDFDISLFVDGQWMETINIPSTVEPFSSADFQFSVAQDFSAIGDYDIRCVVSDADDEYFNNDTLDFVISKVHILDATVSIDEITSVCSGTVEVDAIITNLGETTISDVQIEVIVNGVAVDIVDATVNIPFQTQGMTTITIEDNLQQTNNNITLNLLNVNNLADGESSNNSASSTFDLESEYEIITFIINTDNWPYENTWEIYDEGANEIVASGDVPVQSNQVFSEDICVNYNSCFTLFVYDSFGDGSGDFQVLDTSGSQIVFNDGNFGSETEEMFCLSESGCEITASVNVSNASSDSANDGIITINTNGDVTAFQYSIDGGLTFEPTSTFSDLAPGTYDIYIQGASDNCIYEEVITIEACTFTSVDITAFAVPSVVSATGSIEITATSGTPPYLYSIDGGQNFGPDNVFPNLAVGTYNVIVQDASDICVYEEGVPIEVDPNLVGIENVDGDISRKIKIYPNPSQNIFNLEIESLSSEAVTFDVFDQFGRNIMNGTMETSTAQISLEDYPSGSYIVRCYNSMFEKSLILIKI